LYILILKFFNSNREYRMFWTDTNNNYSTVSMVVKTVIINSISFWDMTIVNMVEV
jgi:hypothetical protein